MSRGGGGAAAPVDAAKAFCSSGRPRAVDLGVTVKDPDPDPAGRLPGPITCLGAPYQLPGSEDLDLFGSSITGGAFAELEEEMRPPAAIGGTRGI